MSGYTSCACRDCMEIAISSDATPALCHECAKYGCDDDDHECLSPAAYGGDIANLLLEPVVCEHCGDIESATCLPKGGA